MMTEQPLRLITPRNADEAGSSGVELVATGRGMLKSILGNDQQRLSILSRNIRWDCITLAFLGDQAVAFAAIKRHWHGPYAPPLRAFAAHFGWISGFLRFALFYLIELRDIRYPVYLYGLKVIPELRKQGIGSVLIENLSFEATKRGEKRIVLEVDSLNDKAINLYERKTFTARKASTFGLIGQQFGIPTLLVMERTLQQEQLSPHIAWQLESNDFSSPHADITVFQENPFIPPQNGTWHSPEINGCWSKERAFLRLDPDKVFSEISVTVTNHHPFYQTVQIIYGPLAQLEILAPREQKTIRLYPAAQYPTIEFIAPTATPSKDYGPDVSDSRALGIFVNTIRFS